jgi:hypothetical protein
VLRVYFLNENLIASRLQVLKHSPHEVQSGSPIESLLISGLIVGQGDLITHTPHSLHFDLSIRIRPGAIFSSIQLIAPIGQIK